MMRSRIACLAICLCGTLLSTAPGARAQNASIFLDSAADGPFDGFPELGASVAIHGRHGAIGAPDFSPPADNPGEPVEHVPYRGVVDIYTADVNRTAWTHTATLHAEDSDPADDEFGAVLAMQADQLLIGTNATVRIYQRRHTDYVLTDKISVPEDDTQSLTPLVFRGERVAFRVFRAQTGLATVYVYKVGQGGRAQVESTLTSPDGPADSGWGTSLALNSDADTLAIGRPGPSGKVFFYERRGAQWKLKDTLAAPNPDAIGFGTGLAFWNDKLVVGAPGEDVISETLYQYTDAGGAAYVFRRAPNHWVQLQRLRPSVDAPDAGPFVGFGTVVSASDRYVLITAPITPDPHTPALAQSALYRAAEGRLSYDRAEGPSTSADLSRRYLISGDGDPEYGEAAVIVDLQTIQ